LFFSKYPSNLGLNCYEPLKLIKLLHRLDQIIVTNRKLSGQPARLLHRDVYVCEWLSPEGSKPIQVSISARLEYFPVVCPGAGRASLSDEGDNLLNIGILHAPLSCSTLGGLSPSNRLATLTLLPPEPHILLPLLLRAAEAEHRVLRRAAEANTIHRLVTPLDEHWRNEFQGTDSLTDTH
jgi:integrator complex subunit 6